MRVKDLQNVSMTKLANYTGLNAYTLRWKAKKGRIIEGCINTESLISYLQENGFFVEDIPFEKVRRTYGIIEYPVLNQLYSVKMLGSKRIAEVRVTHTNRNYVMFEEVGTQKMHSVKFELWRKMRPEIIKE